MKAKEAPEKIYVPTTGNELHYHMCGNKMIEDFKKYMEDLL